MKNHTYKYLTLPTLILLLAACGSSEPTDQTVPLGNSHKATGTAHPNPSPSSSDNSPANNSEPSSSSSAGDTTSIPTLAGGQEATLTEAELADYRAGKYVPATEKHPAYNVPVPKMPAVAKEQTVEGAAAFAEYWRDTLNYVVQTGDRSYFDEATDDVGMSGFVSIIDAIEENYQEGNWITGFLYTVEPADDQTESSLGSEQDIIISYTFAEGEVYAGPSEKIEDLRGDGEPGDIKMTLRWEDGWIVKELRGKDS